MDDQQLAWHEPQTPEEIMDEAISQFNLDSIYVLFSGGKDSVSCAHYIATNYPDKFKACVFTNTGISSQETRKFVISYCKEMGWPLIMTWPEEKERYYKIVMKHGFAGPGDHQMYMGYLKFHNWYYFLRGRIRAGENACFISGVRKKESRQRNKFKKYTKTPVDRYGKVIFVKPFLYKNGEQLWQYFNEHELKKTKVYEWLNKSGECLCGAFTVPFELKMLQTYDPLSFENIKWLEAQVQLHGTKKAKKWGTWGEGHNAKDIEAQTTFEDYCGESCQVE